MKALLDQEKNKNDELFNKNQELVNSQVNLNNESQKQKTTIEKMQEEMK